MRKPVLYKALQTGRSRLLWWSLLPIFTCLVFRSLFTLDPANQLVFSFSSTQPEKQHSYSITMSISNKLTVQDLDLKDKRVFIKVSSTSHWMARRSPPTRELLLLCQQSSTSWSTTQDTLSWLPTWVDQTVRETRNTLGASCQGVGDSAWSASHLLERLCRCRGREGRC